MKVLGVEKRDIFAAVEFSLPELRNIASFLEKAIQTYVHVYGDSNEDVVDYINQFYAQVDKLIEEIDNGS
ncbi:MAG: hypothetical protein E3J43_07610 [Candidatus Heimdallarchaeota archaeon]|nr:MAG: hypothetical protein E3J43_07610 [Candidatus Heimdallarchaeota archaeon]